MKSNKFLYSLVKRIEKFEDKAYEQGVDKEILSKLSYIRTDIVELIPCEYIWNQCHKKHLFKSKVSFYTQDGTKVKVPHDKKQEI